MLRSTGSLGGSRFAFTDRRGGVSHPPYAELNLGDHVGDDPAAVAANRRLLAKALDLAITSLVFMAQVHGREVAVLDRVPAPGQAPPEADALVSSVPGLALIVLVADCVPVLLADQASGVVGVAHAGRRGVESGVVTAVVEAMRGLGARPEAMSAAIGPAVCARCYAVPAELADRVVSVVPATRAVGADGAAALDLPAGVAAQLAAAGVGDVRRDPTCTVESPDLYSYRRDGVTGRFAGVVLT